MLDLKNLDIEFLIDKSGSMATKDCPNGKSRWEYAQETTLALASMAEAHDPDGICVVPFANTYKTYEGVTAAKVSQVFAENSPMGGTDTANVLKYRLDEYFVRRANGGAKPVCIFVLTDGEPNDRQAVVRTIVDAANRIDSDNEIAIQFIQIGTDPSATDFLTFLDDGLVSKHGAKFDIVDTNKLDSLENFTFEALLEKSFAD